MERERESLSFAGIFKGSRAILVNRIDVSYGLLDELLDNNVITKRHVRDIKTGSTEHEKVEKLLDILERRDDSLVPAFKDALKTTDQQYIWDKFLSSPVVSIPCHVSVTSSSPETNPVPPNFEETFATLLLTIVKLLNKNISPSEIRSLKSDLNRPDLEDIDREILISRFDSKIENAFRQQWQDTNTLQSLKVAFRKMLIFDFEPAFAEPSHSIAIYLLCTTAEGVMNLRKMMDSGTLKKILTAVVVEQLGSTDFMVELGLNPDDYKSAMECFDGQLALNFSTREEPNSGELLSCITRQQLLMSSEKKPNEENDDWKLQLFSRINHMEANQKQTHQLLEQLVETDWPQLKNTVKLELENMKAKQEAKQNQKMENEFAVLEKQILLKHREAEMIRRETELAACVTKARDVLTNALGSARNEIDAFEEQEIPKSRAKLRFSDMAMMYGSIAETDTIPQKMYISELPHEMIEMILMKVFFGSLLVRCSILLREHPEMEHERMLYSYSFEMRHFRDSRKSFAKLTFPLQVTRLMHNCFEELALVCTTWWQKMTCVSYTNLKCRRWFTRKLRQNVLRFKRHSVLLQIGSVRKSLLDLIEPNYGLLDELVACAVLTSEEYSKVQTDPSVYARNSAIFECIASDKSEERCRGLVKALEETDQQHVANYIQCSGVSMIEFGDCIPLDKTRQTLLKKSRRIMIDKLEVSEVLLAMLLAEKCINHRQSTAVRAADDSYAKARRLIDILTRRSVADFKKFVGSLNSVDQQHIAAILSSDEGHAERI